MRIAIPSTGTAVSDLVDTRFGRAPFIILVTPDTGETVSLPNPYASENGGVGPRVVQLLIQNNVTHLIAPRIGGHAEEALRISGIQVYIWEGVGSVLSAIEQFNAGTLSLITDTVRNT